MQRDFMRSAETIEWDDSLLTGVSEIDEQHRILVNTLIEADAKLTGEPDSALFERITRDLLAYAIYHFDTEERLILQNHYDALEPDGAATHLMEHRQFSQRVVDLRTAAHHGAPGSREALLSFLKSWLIHHIRSTDQRLGRFILDRLASEKPAAP
jgi:hemerythrin-like metal-binding protein